MDDERQAQIAGLTALREYVVKARRTSVIAVGDKDDAIKHIVECQEALRAIDEAIAEENRSPPPAYDLAAAVG